jgi:hypothetical protein
LSSPPTLLLVVSPYLVNASVKIASALESKRRRKISIEEILRRNKPADKPDILSDQQVNVLDGVVAQSNLRVATSGTLIGSTIVFLIVTLKNSQSWLWGVFIGAAVVAFLLWCWITRLERYSDPGPFSISVGNWAVIAFCAFDLALGIISAITYSPST